MDRIENQRKSKSLEEEKGSGFYGGTGAMNEEMFEFEGSRERSGAHHHHHHLINQSNSNSICGEGGDKWKEYRSLTEYNKNTYDSCKLYIDALKRLDEQGFMKSIGKIRPSLIA